MADIPVKSIADIEVKSEVSDNDKILILDSVSEEARLASKEELKGDKWDTWSKWDKWDKWDKGDKWDKWDTWSTWPQWVQWERWLQGLKWDKGDKWDKWDQWEKGNTWEKWDTWAEIEWVEWIDNDMVFLKNDWTYVTLEWAKDDLKWTPWADGKDWKDWKDWADWVHIVSAAFNGNDIDFTESDWNIVTLEDAKVELKWDKWDTGNKGDKWDKGDKGDTWASITSAVFSWNDISFWKDDQTTVILENAKNTLKWPQWEQGIQWVQWIQWEKWDKWDKGDTGAKWDTGATWATWPTWPQWVSVTGCSKISWTGAAGTTDVYRMTFSNNTYFDFNVYNWANWEGSWDMIAANNLSDLTNFGTARTNLWVYSKTEIDTLLANFWWFEVVATLPTTDIKSNVIYLLWPIGTGADKYEEWIYYSSTWTKIWETSVDLSPYLNLNTQTSDNITQWSSNLFLTSQERTKISNTSWTNTGDQSASDFDIKDLADSTGLRTTWNNKQNAISDLSTIRSWASAWATAVQPWDLSAIATSGKLEDATWDADDISEWTNHKFLTSAERTKLGNTSWTNTGDETASTIKTKLWAASANADGYLKKEDFATFNWKQDAITNSDDITQWSTNLFMTAWERVKVGNLSWTNSWDETTATIKTKLWSASASADWYLTKEDFATFNGKQDTLVSWTNIKTINGNSILWSWDLPVSWLPSWWTEWQILMIVSWTPTWVTPTAKWFKMLSPNSPLTVPYDWYGTEAQYSSASKSNDTEYRTV